ncbi:glycosyltransferase [Candidatus Parcubacteria bacterium]|nr:glycosyltransferase [Candidatus Parcubacteria bacterium]
MAFKFYRKNGFFINQEKIYKPNDVGFVCDNKSINNQQLTINNFLFVGKLERHKGILLLLNVFEKLTAGLSSRAKPADSAGKSRDLITSKKLADEISPQGRNDKIVLHIIGDGSLMPEVKKYAEKNLNIKIHGTLPRGELQKFYAQAKAVIVPSIVYENAPNVVYEALSCGAPVIVSRIGGAYEPIRDGENGDTFNPGDAEDLAEKIKKYI